MAIYTFVVPCVKRTYPTGATKPANGTTWAVGARATTDPEVQPAIGIAHSGSPGAYTVTFTADGTQDMVYATVTVDYSGGTVENYLGLGAGVLSLFPGSGFDDAQAENIWYVCRHPAYAYINGEVGDDKVYLVRPFYLFNDGGSLNTVSGFSWDTTPTGALESGDYVTYTAQPTDSLLSVAVTGDATLPAQTQKFGAAIGVVHPGNVLPAAIETSTDDDELSLSTTRLLTGAPTLSATGRIYNNGTIVSTFSIGTDTLAPREVTAYAWNLTPVGSGMAPVENSASGPSVELRTGYGYYEAVLTVTDEWAASFNESVFVEVEPQMGGAFVAANNVLYVAGEVADDEYAITLTQISGGLDSATALLERGGLFAEPLVGYSRFRQPVVWGSNNTLNVLARYGLNNGLGESTYYALMQSSDGGRAWSLMTISLDAEIYYRVHGVNLRNGGAALLFVKRDTSPLELYCKVSVDGSDWSTGSIVQVGTYSGDVRSFVIAQRYDGRFVVTNGVDYGRVSNSFSPKSLSDWSDF